MTAAIVKVILRELIKLTPRSWKNFATKPLAKQPRSPSRKGSQTNMAISFRLKCSVSTKKIGTQKLMVPHAGSARKRAMPIPQKLRWLRICLIDVFLLICFKMLFLPRFNIVALFIRKAFSIFWIFITKEPK